MKRKSGFTLLELLVAATIMGALAVLATVSYRHSAMETRIAAAKLRTEVLARAVQRFRLDYGSDKLPSAGVELVGPDSIVECNPTSADVLSLFNCGYLQNDGGWRDGYIQYYVCNGNRTTIGTACKNSTINKPLACMRGRNWSKVPEKYKVPYAYCVNETSQGE